MLYYFPKFRNTKEEKYPRSLLLENGVVKKICVQETYNSFYNENRHSSANVVTERKTYSHVNDPDCKLYMSPKEYEQALSLDFPFPKVVQIAAKEYSELG